MRYIREARKKKHFQQTSGKDMLLSREFVAFLVNILCIQIPVGAESAQWLMIEML